MLSKWLLSRIFDSQKFLQSTSDFDFSYTGRWASGDYLGVYGMLGVILPHEDNDEVQIVIYYSGYQGYRPGELDFRFFKPAKQYSDLPVARKHGGDTLFSYEEKGQLIWLLFDHKSKVWKTGFFHTIRPTSGGPFKLKERHK